MRQHAIAIAAERLPASRTDGQPYGSVPSAVREAATVERSEGIKRSNSRLVIQRQGPGEPAVVVCTCGAASAGRAFGVERSALHTEWTVSGPDGAPIVSTLSYERAIELARLLAGFSCHGSAPGATDV